MSSAELVLAIAVALVAIAVAAAWVRLHEISRLADSLTSWPGRIEMLERQLRNVPAPPPPPIPRGSAPLNEDEWVPPTPKRRE